jgi:hypothetical protein
MRLALYVNGQHIVRASLEARGYLSATLTLSNGLKDEQAGSISVVAYDLSEEPNSITSVWKTPSVTIGDRVELRILPDGEGDPPIEVRRSSASPNNLFSDVEQARLLLAAIKACDTEMMKVVERAKGTEPPDELEKIHRAVGSIIVELDHQLVAPTLRRHPTLLSEAQANGLI